MTTTTTQPTVMLVIDESYIAFTESGEMIEAFLENGEIDWENGAICDHRGAGGEEGYRSLLSALEYAEVNAKLAGYDIVRLPK